MGFVHGSHIHGDRGQRADHHNNDHYNNAADDDTYYRAHDNNNHDRAEYNDHPAHQQEGQADRTATSTDLSDRLV